jgi:hypothetical protein
LAGGASRQLQGRFLLILEVRNIELFHRSSQEIDLALGFAQSGLFVVRLNMFGVESNLVELVVVELFLDLVEFLILLLEVVFLGIDRVGNEFCIQLNFFELDDFQMDVMLQHLKIFDSAGVRVHVERNFLEFLDRHVDLNSKSLAFYLFLKNFLADAA